MVIKDKEMSAIVRKALLIKNPSGKKSDSVKNNFAVIKCESAAGRTFFELPDVIGDGAECDLIVYDGENILFFNITGKDRYDFNGKFDARNGFCAALADRSTGNIVLFGNSLNVNVSSGYIRALYEKNNKKNDKTADDKQKKSLLFEEENSGDRQTGTAERKAADADIIFLSDDQAHSEETSTVYDDEAVASENYYENVVADDIYGAETATYTTARTDKPDNEKINYMNGAADNCEAANNYVSTDNCGATDKGKNDYLHSATSCDRQEEQNAERPQKSEQCACQNETAFGSCPFDGNYPAFYSEKRVEIEELFCKYPPIGSLSDYIPESKWVKIEYKKDGFYIIGVISRAGIPVYIVYGVPGVRDRRPRGFERYSVFLPESLFSSNGRGYWCSFQNAETGKTENPD